MVTVCVSHDVLRFNTTAEPMAIRNPITKRKSQRGGHERGKTERGGGGDGRGRTGGSSTCALCTELHTSYILKFKVTLNPIKYYFFI